MSWTRYLFHDFFTAQELNSIDSRMKRQREIERHRSRSDAQNRERLEQQIDSLEDEIGRLSLLTHALTEACLNSGTITREQLQELIKNIDASDGVIDGKLGRADNPTTHEADHSPSDNPIEFLSDLEKKERGS